MKGRCVETKLECLEYFIRHKVVFTDAILNKIGIEQNAMCKVCQEKEEGILHMFLYCKELEEFLKKCKCLIKDLTEEWDENGMEWNRVVMFGWGKKCQEELWLKKKKSCWMFGVCLKGKLKYILKDCMCILKVKIC